MAKKKRTFREMASITNIEGLLGDARAPAPATPEEAKQARDSFAEKMESKGVVGTHLPLSALTPHPANPRDPDIGLQDSHLQQMADSIGTVGQVYPLTVLEIAEKPGEYWIIDGVSRWSALRLANVDQAWVIPVQAQGRAAAQLSHMANLHKRNSPMEYAYAWQKLYSDYGSDAEVAEIVGKDRTTVSKYRRLAVVPRPWLLACSQPAELTFRQCEALMRLADKAQSDEKLSKGINKEVARLTNLPRASDERKPAAVIQTLRALSRRSRSQQPASPQTWQEESLDVSGRSGAFRLRQKPDGWLEFAVSVQLPSEIDHAKLKEHIESSLKQLIKQ